MARDESQAFDVYNIFRQRAEPAVCCAVRQDRVIPTFISGPAWTFSDVARADAAPPGFRPGAAASATELVGYYVFHALSA